MAAYFFRPSVTYGLSRELVLYPLYKLVATTLCVSLPIPVGLFAPVFVAGAAIGRLYGEVLVFISAGGGGAAAAELAASHEVGSRPEELEWWVPAPCDLALVGAAAIGLGAVALAAGPEIAAGAAVATAGGAARTARFAKIAAMAIAAGAVVAAAVKEGTEQLRERTEKRVVS